MTGTEMLDASAAERCGTSDEIAEAGAFPLGEHAGFITGTDLLIDGGVIDAIRTGEYTLRFTDKRLEQSVEAFDI